MEAVDGSLSPPIVATPGRELAARALLAGPDCSQQRVSDLLGVSRRTIGRMAEADLTTALRDPQVLEGARTCLAETASRGSTAEERDGGGRVAAGRRPATNTRSRGCRRHAAGPRRTRPRAAASPSRRPTRAAPADGSGRQRPPRAPPAPPPLPQVDALRRQQQRILHRSALIDYVLAAEKRGGGPLTMGDALAELLADITEAARTIGTLLRPSARLLSSRLMIATTIL